LDSHLSNSLLRGRPPVAEFYRFIDVQKADHRVAVLCRDLQISRSAYYQWRTEAEARRARARAKELLVAEITLIWVGSRHTYGVPRIHAELRRRGRPVNRKKLEKLMREHRIVGCHRRRGRRSLTKQEKAARFAPDLIGRDFTAERPGQRLVGDVTYIPTADGWPASAAACAKAASSTPTAAGNTPPENSGRR
jgi:putative transposase